MFQVFAMQSYFTTSSMIHVDRLSNVGLFKVSFKHRRKECKQSIVVIHSWVEAKRQPRQSSLVLMVYQLFNKGWKRSRLVTTIRQYFCPLINITQHVQ